MKKEWFTPIKTQQPQESPIPNSKPFWKLVFTQFFENRYATLGLILLFVMTLFALFGPVFSPYTYFEIQLPQKNLPPSTFHLFGTDDLGRDLFTRCAFGARISLFIGVAAALIDVCIGVLWGGISAFSGGRTDEIMMRIADTLYAIPYLLVVILFMVVMGPGLITILVAMTLLGWITMAKIVRAQILQIKQQPYVLASKALGGSYRHVLIKHLIPNAMGPIIVTTTLTIPIAIFTEALLSFLGLGVQVPIASWGTMASESLPALQYYPWRLLFPAALISSTMLGFNMVGDGLRDALEPKR